MYFIEIVQIFTCILSKKKEEDLLLKVVYQGLRTKKDIAIYSFSWNPNDNKIIFDTPVFFICSFNMSWFIDFKRWVTVWALTFAFSFPEASAPRRAIYFLQMFLFRGRRDWIHKDESHGYWIAEDLKKNAKREAIQDRISEANVIILWVPGKTYIYTNTQMHILIQYIGGGFRFDLGKLYTSTFATWMRALDADKGIKSMVFVADYSKYYSIMFIILSNVL